MTWSIWAFTCINTHLHNHYSIILVRQAETTKDNKINQKNRLYACTLKVHTEEMY